MSNTGIQLVPCNPEKAKAYRATRQAPFGMITAGCMVHYAGPGQRQVVAQIGFDRRVKKPEQVYVREQVVGLGEQLPVDCGWIKEPGMLLVVNQAAKGSNILIILSICGMPFAQALPGECIQYHPIPGTVEKLMLSCIDSSDSAPITLYAFPG